MSPETITALCIGAGGVLTGILTGLIAWRKSGSDSSRADFAAVITVLQQQIADLRRNVDFLHSENVSLRVAQAASQAANDTCHAENTKLKARVSELEREIAAMKGKPA